MIANTVQKCCTLTDALRFWIWKGGCASQKMRLPGKTHLFAVDKQEFSDRDQVNKMFRGPLHHAFVV